MGKTIKQTSQKITLAAVAGLMLVATPAIAQPPENHGPPPHGGPAQPRGDHGGGGPGWGGARPNGAPDGGGQPMPGPQGGPRPQPNFGGNPGGAPAAPQGGQHWGDGNRGGDHDRGNFNRGPDFNRGQGYNPGRGPWGPGASGQPRYNPGPQRGAFDEHRAPGPGRAYNAWSNNWRADRRYDWRGWRDSHREIYHMGRYYAPYRGYAYRRLSIGIMLDPLFYGDGYMIYDPGAYRLPPAYGPYRWVRYYNDAVLVDTYTGQVVDVLYGFFW